MGRGVRKLTADASRTKTSVLFINQLRQKIGVMFGNPETTTGGNALRFFSSVRLDVRRIGKVTAGDASIGNRTRVKIVKNKLAPPFQEAEFDIRWGEGVDRWGELVDHGLSTGILTKAGAHYSLEGTTIGQGREKVRTYFQENPQAVKKVLTSGLPVLDVQNKVDKPETKPTTNAPPRGAATANARAA
jgi:recombination protein RecA